MQIMFKSKTFSNIIKTMDFVTKNYIVNSLIETASG